MKSSIRHHQPKIQHVITQNGTKYTLAFPPLTSITCRHDDFTSVELYLRIQGNFYSEAPPPFQHVATFEEKPPGSPLKAFFSSFPRINSDYTDLRVNLDLQINSLRQWHDLTKENPNFMREQFDPDYPRPAHYYDNPKTSTQYELQTNYAYYDIFEPNPIPVLAKHQHPSARSIFHAFINQPILKLSLPRLALVQIEEIGKLLCLMHTKGNNYVPLYLPNVDPLGCACLGNDSINHYHQQFDYFWNSIFDSPDQDTRLNPDLTIESLQQWQELTQQNPNFFQEQLDPNFAELISPILYNLQGNQLSWILQ